MPQLQAVDKAGHKRQRESLNPFELKIEGWKWKVVEPFRWRKNDPNRGLRPHPIKSACADLYL